MRHQIGNVVSVGFSFVRLNAMKIVHGRKIKFKMIERISPNVVFDIDRKSQLLLGDKVRIHSGSRITAANGATVKIGDNCRINNNCRIASRSSITLGDGIEFGPGVLVYDHDHNFRDEGGIKTGKYDTDPVIIGKNTWVGANAIILRGTVIGENCVVGAGSVIKGSFPDNVLIIQKRETDIIEISQSKKVK